MTTFGPELEGLMARVARLERQNRWLRRGAGLTGLALATGAVMGAQNRTPEVIEAQQFVVRDGNGKLRARLGLQPFAVGVYLYDADGKPRAALIDKFEMGTQLQFSDHGGQVRTAAGANADGRPFLTFLGSEAGTIAALDENGQGGGELKLFGHRRDPSVRTADAGIYLLGTGGDVVLRSRLRDGAPEAWLQVNSPAGSRARGTLTVNPAGSSLAFYDARGAAVRTVP